MSRGLEGGTCHLGPQHHHHHHHHRHLTTTTCGGAKAWARSRALISRVKTAGHPSWANARPSKPLKRGRGPQIEFPGLPEAERNYGGGPLEGIPGRRVVRVDPIYLCRGCRKCAKCMHSCMPGPPSRRYGGITDPHARAWPQGTTTSSHRQLDFRVPGRGVRSEETRVYQRDGPCPIPCGRGPWPEGATAGTPLPPQTREAKQPPAFPYLWPSSGQSRLTWATPQQAAALPRRLEQRYQTTETTRPRRARRRQTPDNFWCMACT